MGTSLKQPSRRFFTSRIDLACMLLVGVVTFIVSFVFALRGIDPHHQGFLLKSAVDVSRGLALYKETFTQYGSLATYLLVPGIWLLGESVLAIQAATCFAYALCGMLLFGIVRRYAPLLVALACPLIAIGMGAFYFWNFHPWPSVFALLFSLFATATMIRFIDTKRTGWLVGCGAATAAMFWCRQPQGLTVLAGIFMLIGLAAVGFVSKRSFWKSLLWFLLGNALVHGALLTVLVCQGALNDWWIQAIQNAFTFAANPTAETAAARPDSIWKIIFIGVNDNPRYDFIWQVLTFGTLAYFLLMAGIVIRRAARGKGKQFPDPALLGCIAFAAFSLFNWPHYYPTLCYRHVFWSDYPMFGVLGVGLFQAVCLAQDWCQRRRATKQTTATNEPGGSLCPSVSNANGASGRNLTARKQTFCALIACGLLLCLCLSNLLVRARIGKSRIVGGGNGANFRTIEQAEEDTVLRYRNDDYGYLNGLYLSPRETRFYDGLFDALSALSKQYPDKNIVNLTPNPLFSVFTSDNPHLRPYDNNPRDFGYPDQMEVTMAYIEEHRPIVISHEPLPGYVTAAYLTDFNGDYWRFAPFYVLAPEN